MKIYESLQCNVHIIRLGNNIGKEKRGNSQHVFLPFDDRNYHLLNGMPLHPSFWLDLRIFFSDSDSEFEDVICPIIKADFKFEKNILDRLMSTMFLIMELDKRSIFQTFWKPDFGAGFLFIELDNSNFGYLLIFLFCWTVQSLRMIGQHLYNTFYKGPPFEFLVNYKNKKHQRGTLVKCVM